MRKMFISIILLLTFTVGALAQESGASAASPTLKVGDGQRSFNGINELRFPIGCVTFSGRTAILSCSGGTGGTGGSGSQNANLFYASPNGSYGLPSWRAIVAADVPSLDAAKITTGTFGTARLGSGTANSSTYLRGDGTWAAVTGGTVTSVGLSLPSLFSVSGSPVTASGTLAATLATQAANKLFAGPASGADAAPTFRSLVEADIPTLAATKIANGSVSDTEFQYLDGVTSALQTQLDGKASASSLSTHVADTANPHAVTKAQVGLASVTNDAQLKIASNLSDLNNAATARTNLGLGTSDSPTFSNLTATNNLAFGGAAFNAWASGSALQGTTGGIFFGTAGDLHFVSNAYWNGSNWIYMANGPASDFYLYNGTHCIRHAASGTAGNVITWGACVV